MEEGDGRGQAEARGGTETAAAAAGSARRRLVPSDRSARGPSGKQALHAALLSCVPDPRRAQPGRRSAGWSLWPRAVLLAQSEAHVPPPRQDHGLWAVPQPKERTVRRPLRARPVLHVWQRRPEPWLWPGQPDGWTCASHARRMSEAGRQIGQCLTVSRCVFVRQQHPAHGGHSSSLLDSATCLSSSSSLSSCARASLPASCSGMGVRRPLTTRFRYSNASSATLPSSLPYAHRVSVAWSTTASAGNSSFLSRNALIHSWYLRPSEMAIVNWPRCRREASRTRRATSSIRF
mmetsp:Transcript_10504/g.33370  ORF Transcript_10504/g.33370 Transcript_10504/m.33370 type:complete len:291 (+) Transcript_10504:572-1444(+)